jgi:LmbE family N-acetylglucosaminyl deacetylase
MTPRLLAVSPHLDDAVLACGDLLAAHPGSVVVTVFAGGPPRGAPLTEWDAASGFRRSDEVIPRRRAEDRAALRLLHARPRWLPFRDAQYGDSPSVEALAEAVGEVLDAERPTIVLVPLGLFHSDHALTHAAALRALAIRPSLDVVAYEDAIYRRLPGLLDERLGRLRAAGFAPAPLPRAEHGCSVRKRQAVACYGSQLRALCSPGRPGIDDAFARERFWRLAG